MVPQKIKVPLVPCGPYSGTPIAQAPDYWLEQMVQWKWVKGTLREAVERELAVRRAT